MALRRLPLTLWNPRAFTLSPWCGTPVPWLSGRAHTLSPLLPYCIMQSPRAEHQHICSKSLMKDILLWRCSICVLNEWWLHGNSPGDSGFPFRVLSQNMGSKPLPVTPSLRLLFHHKITNEYHLLLLSAGPPLEVPFRPLGHSALALDFYQFLLPRNPQLGQGSMMLVFKLYAQYHMLFLFKLLVITLFLVIFISSLLKCFISRSLLKLSLLSHLQNIRQADVSSIALVITPGEKHPCSQSR